MFLSTINVTLICFLKHIMLLLIELNIQLFEVHHQRNYENTLNEYTHYQTCWLYRNLYKSKRNAWLCLGSLTIILLLMVKRIISILWFMIVNLEEIWGAIKYYWYNEVMLQTCKRSGVAIQIFCTVLYCSLTSQNN